MSKIVLTVLLGLILCAGFSYFLRQKTNVDCDLVNTALLVEVPKQKLGFPKTAFARNLSEKACNINNIGKILWGSWYLDIGGLVIDLVVWLAAAATLIYGSSFAMARLSPKQARRT